MKHLRLYESESKLKKIATNEYSWSWEYDSDYGEAILWFDPTGTNSLFLEIKNTHTKHGLGAGKITRQKCYERVGTINKPELKKIRQLLSKYKYSDDVRFKMTWIDNNGKTNALGKIIKGSRYLKMINLRHSLAKDDTQKEIVTPKDTTITQSGDINIMKYGRGYVVYGEGTRKLKSELGKIKARFNFRLTHPETGKRFSGWVIPPAKLQEVKDIVGVEQIQESSEYNREEIQRKYSDTELFQLFPKMYDRFFDIMSEHNELEVDNEDLLELNFAEAVYIYISENIQEQTIELIFLENYLKDNEFEVGTTYEYDDLDDDGLVIYDNLEQRLEIVFWTLIEEVI